MRFERKYKLYNTHLAVVPNFLFLQGFKEIYTKRIINSIYYDTDNLKLFFESENGFSERKKIRLRFYNQDVNNSNIEYKKKKDMLNDKEFFETSSHKEGLLFVKFLDNSINIRQLIAPINIEKIYKPKIMIQYLRRYFLSKDKGIRLTLDHKIIFMKATRYASNILIGPKRISPDSVVELKYEENYQPDFNFLDKFTQEFNLTLSRSSKYALGIRTLNLS